LRRNESLLFGNEATFAAAYPGWTHALTIQNANAVAVVPTRSDRRPVGVLEVFFAAPQPFGDGQRTLIALTADQIGNALGQSEAREREHEAAFKLQESLLGPPSMVDGVGHTTRYLAAEATLHIGGDWHNAQRLPDGRIVAAVGDVVGRGLVAATVM